MDLSKAFDTLPQELIVLNLKEYGAYEAFSILGPLLFNIRLWMIFHTLLRRAHGPPMPMIHKIFTQIMTRSEETISNDLGSADKWFP